MNMHEYLKRNINLKTTKKGDEEKESMHETSQLQMTGTTTYNQQEQMHFPCLWAVTQIKSGVHKRSKSKGWMIQAPNSTHDSSTAFTQ